MTHQTKIIQTLHYIIIINSQHHLPNFLSPNLLRTEFAKLSCYTVSCSPNKCMVSSFLCSCDASVCLDSINPSVILVAVCTRSLLLLLLPWFMSLCKDASISYLLLMLSLVENSSSLCCLSIACLHSRFARRTAFCNLLVVRMN